MAVDGMELEALGGCFVCGKDNQDGLRLEFLVDEENLVMESTWVPEARFQGYKNLTHGGLVATLLDEAVAKLAFEVGMPAVTAEMNVRFRAPLLTGSQVVIKGQLTEVKERFIMGVSEVVLKDGRTAASATVKLIRERK